MVFESQSTNEQHVLVNKNERLVAYFWLQFDWISRAYLLWIVILCEVKLLAYIVEANKLAFPAILYHVFVVNDCIIIYGHIEHCVFPVNHLLERIFR